MIADKKTCLVDWCDRPRAGRSEYCGPHIQRLTRGKPPMDAPFRGSVKVCTFDGCDRKHYALGICQSHYQQRKVGRELAPIRDHSLKEPCAVDGCSETEAVRGYCRPHYKQAWQGMTPRIKRGAEWRPTSAGYLVMSVRLDNGRRAQILQHRVVMEDHLGRPLLKHENVHHINGDRADNRIENLELWNTSQPAGQRIEDKVAWAKELLAQYEPEALVRTLRAAA